MTNTMMKVAMVFGMMGCVADGDAADPVDELDVTEQAIVDSSGCRITVDLRTETAAHAVTIPTSLYASRDCTSFQVRMITGNRGWRAATAWHGGDLDGAESTCRGALVFSILTRYEAPRFVLVDSQFEYGHWRIDGCVPVAGGCLPRYSCDEPRTEWTLAANRTYEQGIAANLEGGGPQGMRMVFYPL
jgi:hypothetical protein